MEFHVDSIDELPELAKEIIRASGEHRLFAFYGEMGAGKTTLILQILKALGVEGEGSSPTFSIVNEYASQVGPVYHFDFYRIESIEEVYDFGYEEYLYSGTYCFMEWPEKIAELLPENVVEVHISDEDGKRKITLNFPS